jgi:xanthine dehydrogenase accessory factor
MSEVTLLVLGKGEIARCIARIANAAAYPVQICERGLQAQDWPTAAVLTDRAYTDSPWPLPPNTHAVIARGHEADPDSVAALLEQGAEHVYLIASARRSQDVMRQALTRLQDPLSLERLSAPAGLALGGRASTDIALAILAEIQWRQHGGPLLPLRELRAAKANQPAATPSEEICPGQRA